MNKKLLFLAGIIGSFTAVGQLSIDSTMVAPIGSTQYQTVDTVPNDGISAGAPGQGVAYDLSDIDFSIEMVTNIVEKAATNSGSEFPNATQAATDGANEVFFNKNSNDFSIVGISAPDPAGGEENFLIKYENPEKILEFPTTYQSAFFDTYRNSGTFFFGQEFQGLQIDSVRFTTIGDKDLTIDGSGTITTAAGIFSNILRERTTYTEVTIIEGCVVVFPGTPCQWQEFQRTNQSYVDYNFFGAQSSFPIAGITYNANEDTVQSVYNNTDPAIVGISEYAKPNTIANGVYPNPAKDIVTFKKPVLDAVLISTDGTETQLSISNNQTNLSGFASGSYFIRATNALGFPELHPVIIVE